MRHLVPSLLLLLSPALLSADQFKATEEGFRLTQDDQYIDFDRGLWTAGIEGAGRIRWQMILWHDDWIFQTLPNGAIHSGPALGDDGSIGMTGSFSTGEGSPPMKYACRIVFPGDIEPSRGPLAIARIIRR